MRRCHRGARVLPVGVVAIGQRRQHLVSRCSEFDLWAGRGEKGDLVALGGRGDGHGVLDCRGVADTVLAGTVLLAAAVARRRDDDSAVVGGVVDGILHSGLWDRTAETHVDDVRPVVGGPLDATDDTAGRPEAAAAQRLHREQIRARCHPDDTETVVRGRRRPGYVGAVVVVVVPRLFTLVVDVAPTALDVRLSADNLLRERLVIRVDTRVDNRDGDTVTRGPLVVSCRRPRLLDPPRNLLFGYTGVQLYRVDHLYRVVRHDVVDLRVAPERPDRLCIERSRHDVPDLPQLHLVLDRERLVARNGETRVGVQPHQDRSPRTTTCRA